MVSSDKRLEEQIELERKQAEEMEAARAARTAEFHKDFRQGLGTTHILPKHFYSPKLNLTT